MGLEDNIEEQMNEWIKEAGAIPDNTCPNVDKLIAEYRNIEEDISYIERNKNKYDSVDEVVGSLPNLRFNDIESIAEDLRKDNEQLRELGRFWYKKTKEVLYQLGNLKDWNRIHGNEIPQMAGTLEALDKISINKE